MIGAVGKMPLHPHQEPDAVGIVVAGHEFLRLAPLDIGPGTFEQPLHGLARGLVPGILAAIAVAATGVDQVRQVELVDPLGIDEVEQPGQ